MMLSGWKEIVGHLSDVTGDSEITTEAIRKLAQRDKRFSRWIFKTVTGRPMTYAYLLNHWLTWRRRKSTVDASQLELI